MTSIEQKKKAKEFSERWKDKGYEKGESQKYWIDLLQNVFDVKNIVDFIEFEDVVHIDKTNGFIDAYIPSTKILIEQKSIDKDLKKAIKQSDGSLLNPFQQAKKYIADLPLSKHPRWVITSNFKSFLVYDMENPNGEPEEILLSNLSKEYYRLQFLVDEKSEHIKKEEELSFKAGDLVGELYDAFSKEYVDINTEKSQKSLNELCVRLVFCLYAEDAGLFGRKNIFHDYLTKSSNLTEMREKLIKIFDILDTEIDKRDPYADPDLNQFPYVNGGLFSNKSIEIPHFTENIKNVLLAKASDNFDWSEISPTIFGAVFESTLNPETRREGGMHYTSIENIHKVIDPLFLDDLRIELNGALAYKSDKTREEKLLEFQNHISSLKFLDPACGSGNFLTETYLSLRRMENEALDAISKDNMLLDLSNIIKVSIQQFYGIEINDFAVKVAKTALWIAEIQMWVETQMIINSNKNVDSFLPLESYDNIKEENALRINWNDVLPSNECSYIMGNPPFSGFTYMSEDAKLDMAHIFPNKKNLDYVCCWYKIANSYINGTDIEVAFISTDTITQGETVPRFWPELNKIIINFAYRSFKWSSEANKVANIYCVIIGFSHKNRKIKKIYDNGSVINVTNINPYIMDGPNILIESRNKPICTIPKMINGNKFADGGFLIIEEKDYEQFIKDEPDSIKFIKPLLGAVEYLNNKKRYCLWLENVSIDEISKYPKVMERVKLCRQNRLNSKAKGIQKFADTPTLVAQKTQDITKPLIIIPRVTGVRKYIPIGFLKPGTVVTDAIQMIPNGDLYDFGILMSSIHMAWMRVFSEKLGTGYRYSKDVVYNNFPWPRATQEQKDEISKTATKILDAREVYSNHSLADIYNQNDAWKYPEVYKAHKENDIAVMKAYGFDFKNITENECVSELMKRYEKIVRYV